MSSSQTALHSTPTPATPVLASVHQVTRTYGSRRALDQVSFEIRAGERVALIGPSGSGKSTLLRTLAGLITTDTGLGRVSVFGELIQKDGKVQPGVRQVRTRLGYIAQSFNLVPRLSLFTNVALGLLGRLPVWRGLLGLWPAQERVRIMTALHRVGVSDYAAQRAQTLSGGQQQRGAIARAMVQQAEMVLADEPVASLDPVSARKVMDLLVDLNTRDGVAVLVTLHQVDYALRYCERIIALKAGQIVFDGPSHALDRETLITIYGEDIEGAFWEDLSLVSPSHHRTVGNTDLGDNDHV